MGNRERARARRIACALVVVACLVHGGAADAQNAERTVAQSLFEEGVRLMREKRFVEACPKLAESHKLDRAGGTILNLAICLEHEGKLASAYVAYEETRAFAKKDDNKQRIQAAEARMAVLRPKLSRVTVSVSKTEGASKVDVRFDGTPLGQQTWGVPFYADVGTHVISAEAPGYKPYRGEVHVEKSGTEYTTMVPALVSDPTAQAAPPAAPAASPAPADEPTQVVQAAKPEQAERPADPQPTRGRGPLPWILVGTGAVLLGAGTVTGVLAFSKHADSDDACKDGLCTAVGVRHENQANTFAWVSNVTIPVGVIAGAVGAYLFLKSPAKASAQISPTLSGLMIEGAF